jgi:hypothetical protein
VLAHTSAVVGQRYLFLIEHRISLEGTMNNMKKIITAVSAALIIGGAMVTTPAAAWGYRHDNGAAIAGAVVGGMALGAAIGAAASQPDYDNRYDDGPRPAYGQPYGYAPAYGYDYDD